MLSSLFCCPFEVCLPPPQVESNSWRNTVLYYNLNLACSFYTFLSKWIHTLKHWQDNTPVILKQILKNVCDFACNHTGKRCLQANLCFPPKGTLWPEHYWQISHTHMQQINAAGVWQFPGCPLPLIRQNLWSQTDIITQTSPCHIWFLLLMSEICLSRPKWRQTMLTSATPSGANKSSVVLFQIYSDRNEDATSPGL